MLSMLRALGSRYYNFRRDEQRAQICFQKILDSEPIHGSEDVQDELKALATRNLAMLDA
jgi:hypothetical protein